jgi:diguanylate cyclase (GGDEF)-like protein
MLLLADNELSERLVQRLSGRTVVAVADPYDALEEMGRRRFPVVVLSPTSAGPGVEGEFAALCRASRRLQRDARLYALCPPRLEMEVRTLVGETLNDYFIYPPSQADLRVLAEPEESTPSTPTTAMRVVEPLTCGDFSRLVGATFSRTDLETALAQMVAAKVHSDLEWVDEGSPFEDVQTLLRLEADPPRLLVARQPVALDVPTEAMLAALSRLLPALHQAAKRTEALHHLAITDELTGAYNRRFFYHATDQILRQAASKNHRVTLLLYDIDDFKSYNDRYGYAAGDDILCEAAQLMRRITREHDIVARIGGDEFAVLFWDRRPPRLASSKPPDSALVLARRFLRALERHEFPSLGPDAVGVLTISGGLASFPADGNTCLELLRKADLALKAVKRTGKKGIRIVGPATDQTNGAPPGRKAKPKR